MDVVLGDEISPRALLNLDAITLIAPAIVDVVLRDDAMAHDVRGIVAAEIHALSVASAVMNVIARKIQTLCVSAVRAEANLIGVVNVALVHPYIPALPEPQTVTATGKLKPTQAEKTHRAPLSHVDYVLFVVRPSDNHLCVFRSHDPNGRFCRAANQQIPHALDTISARADLKLVSGLQGSHGFNKRRSVLFGGGPGQRVVRDGSFRRDGCPCRIVAGRLGRVADEKQ